MRKLTYELANGIVVKTYDEAVASGQIFTGKMVDIIEEYDDSRLTDKQKTNRRKLG